MSGLRDYIDNPDSIPNDPDKVAEILASMESEGDSEDTTEAEPEKAEAKAEPKEEPKEEPKAEKEEPPVVMTKDGKHQMPFSVLEAERKRSRELQQQLAEAQARLEEAVSAKQSGETAAPTETGADDMEAAIAQIESEYGEDHEFVKPLRAQQAKLRAMEAQMARLDEFETWRKQQEQKAADSAVSEVDQAIDAIPELAALRDEQGPLWDAAVAVDARLMKDPEFAGKSLKERFAEVAKLMGLNKAKPKPDDNLEKVVDEKLAAKERSRPPASLSDLPGGATFEQSEKEVLENMSVTEVAAKFDKMTPEQREAFLAGF